MSGNCVSAGATGVNGDFMRGLRWCAVCVEFWACVRKGSARLRAVRDSGVVACAWVMQAGRAVRVAAWDIRLGGELCLCV